MPFLRLIFAPVFALSLFFASILNANAENFVMCPSLETIRKEASKISTAKFDNLKTYTAATDHFVFDDHNLS